MTTNHHDNLETRQRLLDAAGEIFAEHGFRNATIRDICEKADANVAAVNYHFRDKEGLYGEVIRYAHRCLAVQPAQQAPSELSPPQRMAAFIHTFMAQLFDKGKPAWHGQLVVREMIDPTSALDRLVDEEIRPRSRYLQSIVRELIGPDATERNIELSSLSIVSQCVFYRHSEPVIARLHPELSFTPEQVAVLADHITRFTLTALSNWSASGPGAPP